MKYVIEVYTARAGWEPEAPGLTLAYASRADAEAALRELVRETGWDRDSLCVRELPACQ